MMNCQQIKPQYFEVLSTHMLLHYVTMFTLRESKECGVEIEKLDLT